MDNVVDFFCYSENLIVEIDGSSHDDIGTQQHDDKRDEELLKYGFKILRFSAIEIKDQLDRVLKEIEANLKPVSSLTTPTPPEGGEM